MTHRRLSRRGMLLATAATVGLQVTARWGRAQEVKPKVEGDTAWYDVREWGIEGKGFSETARYFDRLPSKAEKLVRPAVWSLSRHSAGMLVRFRTTAAAISARYELLSDRLAMSHMPATGVSGLDLYARDGEQGDRWLSVARPTGKRMQLQLAAGIDATADGSPRLYTLYLPLYNGVESLQVGVPAGTDFAPVALRNDPPIVFYGTSIMHGACASRPGMSISGIVGRRCRRPVINLGFSGNGRMEKEVGALIAELPKPAALAIDCLPNMQGDEVAKNAEPLVKQLRAAHPSTPIILVEDRTYAYARFRKASRQRHQASREALKKAFENLQAAGLKNVHYLDGPSLLGDDGEATTDGSHPNDLGMVRYADAYQQLLTPLLKS